MKVGFIGCGNMGSALMRAAACDKDIKISVYDKDTEKAERVAEDLSACVCTPEALAAECDVIYLGTKPNVIPDAAESIRKSIKAGAVVVSMAAGVKLEKLTALLPDTAIIRIMPNTPAAVGRGMILWCKNALVSEKNECDFIRSIGAAGELLRINEEKIDAGTAVSGCGPAFVYMFIDAMIKGGIEAGLSPEEARLLATTTVEGAAVMTRLSDKTPEELRIAVCSPGGSTIEGVKSLMNDKLEDTVIAAVSASFKRTVELGK